MAKVFISYRREDTSGAAGRLASDLFALAGRRSVFIDVDSVGPAEYFEDLTERTLRDSQVAFVLIGKHWLDAALPDGRRRLDQPDDYVRREVAQALARPDLTVVPVLVDGADMPSVEQLPNDLARLTKINAAELNHKRWRSDVRTLWEVARRHDSFPRRLVYATRVRAVQLTGAAAVVAGLIAVAVLPGAGSAPSPKHSRDHPVLSPASVPSNAPVCQRKLRSRVDGTVAPLTCSAGRLNSVAWQYFANHNLLILSAGPTATPGLMRNAVCADLRQNRTTNIPKETQAVLLAFLYYGWGVDVALPVDPATAQCS